MNDCILIIMRHGKSDWSTGSDTDFDRPLTKRGLKAAVAMGIWLKKHKYIPDRIVSSPALRAKLTAQNVCNQFKKSQKIIWDDRIYDAELDALLDVIGSHAKRSNIMLMIGHNPGLNSLLGYLSKDDPERDKKGKLLTTAAIAILKYKKNLINTDQRSANLIKLLRPKDLDNS